MVYYVRILIIDIETKPSLAYIWSLWDNFVPLDRLIESGEMICWSAKWLGESDIEFRSVYHDGKKKMVKRVWELLNEADVVMHFNGKRFDVPHIQREFLEAGLLPPAPFKQIDLLDTVKQQFRFVSNKLGHVSKKLGFEGKHSHDGFDLWVKCMNKDAKAWEQMKKYNIQDVVLLEKMYAKLQPWIKSHPSYAAHYGDDVCPKCGSDKLENRGFAMLTTGKYQRFHCKGCGGWSRSTKRAEGTSITQIT